MRKSRFTDEQIVAVLREADRTSVAESAKKHKVSEQTIYVSRKHFAGLAPADMKRLKALELENARLKRLLAERDLEVDIMREVNRKNGKPTGAPRADPLRSGTGSVATTSLWAAGGTAFDHGLPAAPTGQGCAHTGRDAAAVGAVSSLWPLPDSHRLAAGGVADGY
jgi:putative transposase